MINNSQILRNYERSPDTLKIWDMCKNGLSAREIAHQTGWKFGKVNSAVRRGRDAGVIPRPQAKPISSGSHHRNYMRLGSISAICNSLATEQVEWLATEARRIECETVAEFILELVRDAHAEQEIAND